MPGDEIVAGDGGNPRHRATAGAGHAIGVGLAIDQHGQQAAGDAAGVGLFLSDAGEHLAAHAVELGRIEGRALDDIGEQRQRAAEIGLERVQRDAGTIGIGPGTNSRTEPFAGFGDLRPGHAGSAFIEQAEGQVLDAKPCPIIGAIAAIERQQQLHDRNRRAPGKFDLHAIGKRGALHRRDGQCRRAAERRRGRALDHDDGRGRGRRCRAARCGIFGVGALAG